MINKFYFIIIVSVIFLSCSALSAQQVNSEIDSLFQLGDSLIYKGDLNQAKKIFEKILKVDMDSLPARAKLGKIAFLMEDWNEVKLRYGEILDRNPENLEALYYRAISYRESGKYKALIQRKLDWDKSKKYFLQAIQIDSLYQDVIFQFATLKRYRSDYEEAVKLGHAQVRLKPALIEPRVRLFKFYRYLIRHRSTKKALKWLDSQPWDHARYAKAEKLRYEEKFDEAEKHLLALLEKPLLMPRQPIYLSLARLYYQQEKQKDAEKHFWNAVNEIRNDVEAALVFEDIKFILKDEELSEYQSLHTVREKIDFFHKIWVSRDPMPASDVNARLAEHYRRILYADKYFQYDGFRTWFNNPDKLSYLNFNAVYKLNEEYNDKGFIYIRHGQRDDWASTIAENVPHNESWLYYRTDKTPQMTFHFFLENTINFWRLGPVIIDPQMLDDRTHWGSIYFRMARANHLERLSIQNEMAEESKKSVKAALATDKHTWEQKVEPLLIPYSGATFRGENGKTLLEIYYGIPLEKLDLKKRNKENSITLESGFSLHDNDWYLVDKNLQQLDVPVMKSRDYLEVKQFLVEPDSYHVAFHILQPETDLLGGWKLLIVADDYSSNSLAMSEIELASRIEPSHSESKFVKNGLNVVPNPSSNYEKQKPVNIYFEIYGLKPEPGTTNFSIEYTLTLLRDKTKKFLGIFGGGGKSSITTKIDREGTDEMSVEYLAIDASSMKAGDYELKITVTDKNSGDSVFRKKKVTLL